MHFLVFSWNLFFPLNFLKINDVKWHRNHFQAWLLFFFLLQLSFHLTCVFTSLASSLPLSFLSLTFFQITGASSCPHIVPANCWNQGVILANWELQSIQNKPITYWSIYDLSLLLSRHQWKYSDQTKRVVTETTGTTAPARRLIFGQHNMYFPPINTMYVVIGCISSIGAG